MSETVLLLTGGFLLYGVVKTYHEVRLRRMEERHAPHMTFTPEGRPFRTPAGGVVYSFYQQQEEEQLPKYCKVEPAPEYSEFPLDIQLDNTKQKKSKMRRVLNKLHWRKYLGRHANNTFNY